MLHPERQFRDLKAPGALALDGLRATAPVQVRSAPGNHPRGSRCPAKLPVVCGQPPLYGSHNSTIPGAHAEAVNATAANVAKRKPASTVSGEQSDRQRSAGASRQTGALLASSTDSDSARKRGRRPPRSMCVRLAQSGSGPWRWARLRLGIRRRPTLVTSTSLPARPEVSVRVERGS